MTDVIYFGCTIDKGTNMSYKKYLELVCESNLNQSKIKQTKSMGKEKKPKYVLLWRGRGGANDAYLASDGINTTPDKNKAKTFPSIKTGIQFALKNQIGSMFHPVVL